MTTAPALQLVHPSQRTTPSPVAPAPAAGLIRAVVEAMMGRRALHQLRPHLTPQAFEALATHRDSGAFRRIRIGSLTSQMPADDAVEASVRIGIDGRWITCVLRLDAVQRAWRCTEFMVLTPRSLAAA